MADPVGGSVGRRASTMRGLSEPSDNARVGARRGQRLGFGGARSSGQRWTTADGVAAAAVAAAAVKGAAGVAAARRAPRATARWPPRAMRWRRTYDGVAPTPSGRARDGAPDGGGLVGGAPPAAETAARSPLSSCARREEDRRGAPRSYPLTRGRPAAPSGGQATRGGSRRYFGRGAGPRRARGGAAGKVGRVRREVGKRTSTARDDRRRPCRRRLRTTLAAAAASPSLASTRRRRRRRRRATGCIVSADVPALAPRMQLRP